MAKAKEIKNDESGRLVELEMTNVELSKRANELIEFMNKKKWTPLEVVFILKSALNHVQDFHGIEIKEMNFERSGLM